MSIALVLLISVYKNNMTIGMYISLVTASFNLVEQMAWNLSKIMQKYSKNKIYLNDLSTFSNLEEIEGADLLPSVKTRQIPLESIEFKNVYFAYPGTDRYILNGLSMKLEKGKQYAFVGKNGAGKTTITKLLTGLYDNYEGDILINEKNIRSYKLEEIKAMFSIVYQDFARYDISLKDNIILGRVEEIENDEKNDILVKDILCNIELKDDVDKLPKGINTILGKTIEGSVDLSGGQWQKIAIGRCLASNAPVYILDEPTASLDPIMESEIYKLFGDISKGKLTILITHRLGAAKLADEILVVDNGIISEYGKHNDLVNKKGIYSHMFESQRSWYNE